nr:unnamed protein product [Digitaria exilis]
MEVVSAAHGVLGPLLGKLNSLLANESNQIDDLKARVKEVKDLKSSYKLDDIACSAFEHPAVDPRLSALFVEEAHLVGIDGPRDDLVNWMVEEENCSTKHCKVLSIVGFGGLGKTTLAREVPCKDDFTKDIDTWDKKQFISKLRELLLKKRPQYLKFEEGTMPKLEKLDVPFFVSVAKAYGFDLGINNLPCLKHADIALNNRDVTSSESKAAAAAIRKEANAHPNHPRVFIFNEMEKDVEENDIDEESSCANEKES